MRKNKRIENQNNFSILTLDDDPIMTSTIQAYFQRSGYHVDMEHEPYRAIERVREGNYDILLLDFLMSPICGDQVVAEIRKFNRDICIILLTGHKSIAPPIKTIRELDIQGYYEKNDRFDQLELLVESCVKSIRQMRTIKNYKNGLSSMVESLPQIYHLQSWDQIADGILETAGNLLNSNDAVLEIGAEFASDLNLGGEAQPMCRTCGEAADAPTLAELAAEPEKLAESAVVTRLPWTTVAVHNTAGQLAGHLSLRTETQPQENQLQLLEVFSKQITAALRNALLHFVVERKNEELTRAYANMNENYMEMIDALRLMVDAKDIYTCGHSERVADLTYQIAAAMGKDEKTCERLRIAGLFHDIGKVGMPDEILLNRQPLTPEQFEVVKQHPNDGARILGAITRFKDVVPAIRAHHERLDGKGYPRGIPAEEIPEDARILSVADSYDAMRSDRSYRKALTEEEAIQQLREGSGTQFDAEVVQVFLSVLGVE